MSIHDGHRIRTKGEFLKMGEYYPDHKVLEVLLYFALPRGDTSPLAHRLMDQFGSVSGVLDALPEDLMKVPGVGEHTVTLLKAAKEVSRRYFTARTELGEVIGGPQDAYPILRPYFFGAREERVYLMALDGKGKNLGVRLVGEGSVNAADMVTRRVVEAALALNATQVILAHNHPSGVAVPSGDDIDTTRKVAQVLRSVGVYLYDHLIFSDDNMVSMAKTRVDFYE